MDGDLTWGGEHTVQCTDDVLWNCAPETCLILSLPINSIENIINKKRLNSLTYIRCLAVHLQYSGNLK